jgi:hypothetical protein
MRYILESCLSLNFDDFAALSLPNLTASGSGVSFVTQGSPFQIKQFALASSALALMKAAFAVVVTRELLNGTSAEAFLKNVIGADLSLGLEAILFDATAADSTRPVGLKNGISATTPDAGSGEAAMIGDLATLVGLVAAVGSTNIVFIASPRQAIKANFKSGPGFQFPVLASSALADRTVCALALDALAFGVGGLPVFDLRDQTALHMEDTSPAALSTVGTPNTVAAPIRSTWQTDTTVIRILQDISWTLRSSTGFAYMTATNWWPTAPRIARS